MASKEIKPNVFFVGAIHPDRPLFDEFMALPDGTSYNAYLIKGSEKTALIDTVEVLKQAELLENLEEQQVSKIDYIISNHAEQDHSGSIPKLLELHPDAKVVTNEKCKQILQDELAIPDDAFLLIKDRETLSLGDKTLEFLFAPWVHWPETMFTYLREDKILFTCDLFGSHIASEEVYATDEAQVIAEAKRYYAGIMMPFRRFIQKHLELISTLEVELIAPSHGPLFPQPSLIVDAHKDWVGDQPHRTVLVAYVSMHGSTHAMADHLVNALKQRNVEVVEANLVTELDKALITLVDAHTLVMGSPTFLAGPHPKAVHAAYLINLMRPKCKQLALFGSDEWGGTMVDQLTAFFTLTKPKLLDPVTARGYPKQAVFAQLDHLAETIAQSVR